MRLRVIVLVYVVLFVGELSWQAVTPLIPSYIARYTLTDSEGALLLSAASLGILLASVPAAWITRHVDPRALTLIAITIITVSNLGTAVLPTYPGIVASRLLYGMGFGLLWVSVSGGLADAAGEHRARALAATTTVVGVGAILGPAYAGFLAQRFALAAPFAGLAIVGAALLVPLLLDRSGTGRTKEPSPPLSDLTHALGQDPDLRTMLLLVSAGAVVWMTADLLVPLRLDAAGYDVGALGLVFTLGSIVFAVTSGVTARRADRWARPRIAAAWSGVLTVATLIPALIASGAAALVFLGVAGLASGVTAALTYPFGMLAVARGRVTVGVITALTNVLWAVAGLVGPVVGGAFSQRVGDQAAFGVLAAGCLVVTLAVASRRSTPEPAPLS